MKSAAVAAGTDIYVFGGVDDNGGDEDFVMKYDTVADAWSILAPMPHACSCHRASNYNGLVYIVGTGEDNEEVLRFDPVSAEWSPIAPTIFNRTNCATFVLGGCLYVAGGLSQETVERYDAATDTWTEVAEMFQ
jgi:N-acetylneuraminic acid mutarotase